MLTYRQKNIVISIIGVMIVLIVMSNLEAIPAGWCLITNIVMTLVLLVAAIHQMLQQDDQRG